MSTSATSFKSLSDIREAILSFGHTDPAYAKKMFHVVPDLPTVPNRAAYLVEKAKNLVVLDIGCTGEISARIKQAAKRYYGVDRVAGDGWTMVDLDHRPDMLPQHDDVEVVILSEFLEHLSNPGYFLVMLRRAYVGRLVYITVPNAGAYHVRNNCEVVSEDHVCWYSYTTLKTLLTRYDYEIVEARWYGIGGHKSEGIIMVAK